MEARDLLAGMLGRTLYVVHSEPAPAADAADGASLFDAHLRHLIDWEQRGVLFAAGPYLKDGEVSSRAMYILRAAGLEEATALAAEEPLHKQGVRTFTIDEWVLNEGRISMTVDFSTQRGGLDGPPRVRLHQNENQQGAA